MALGARQPEGARKRERPGTIPGLRETTTTRPLEQRYHSHWMLRFQVYPLR